MYDFDSQRKLLLGDLQLFKYREKEFTVDELQNDYNKCSLNISFTDDKKRCLNRMTKNGDLVDCGNGKYKFSKNLSRDCAPMLRIRQKNRKWK